MRGGGGDGGGGGGGSGGEVEWGGVEMRWGEGEWMDVLFPHPL